MVSAAPPKSPSINEYQALLLRSPFIIKKPEVKTPEVVVNSALALRGVAALDDGWYVVVVDRKNPNQNIILREGEAANDQGLRLVRVNQNKSDYNKTTVQVMSGGRTQTVGYNPADIQKSIAAAKAPVTRPAVKPATTTRPPLPTTQTNSTPSSTPDSSTRRPRVRRTVTAPPASKTK
ncbi:hypothetical protein ACFPK9_05275 [Rubritalea spongiae]|uniref:Uncharacterized protein n=1 Tax=Rubritalea spongiae TaxID=430797 RepID=A0ABW5E4M5_9BACT